MAEPIRRLLAVAAAFALAGALACSFSYSSESISDSSKSSSGSSGGDDDDEARFREDVELYTVAYVGGGGRGGESFLGGIGDLARQRGVSDWESDEETWEAIGRGLGRSDLGDAERTAYAKAWAGDDDDKADALDRGLAAAQ